MTDPIDETQPQPATPDEPPAAPDPAGGAPASAPATGAGTGAETGAETGAGTGAGTGAETGTPGLRVDPARPSDGNWREPAWFPPRTDRGRSRDRRSGTFAIVVGLILIAIGAWSFLEHTLGIDLPRIRWSSLWPVVLIVIGGLILVRSIQRKPGGRP